MGSRTKYYHVRYPHNFGAKSVNRGIKKIRLHDSLLVRVFPVCVSDQGYKALKKSKKRGINRRRMRNALSLQRM